MDLNLRGRRAVVTGATRGIGRAVAELLAHEGCNVAVCARGAEDVAETVDALRRRGVEAHGAALNVRDGPGLCAWVERAGDALGGIDILVANVSAGGGMDSERNWVRNFEIDLMAAVRACEAALPRLKRSEAGAVVLVGTMAASECFAGPMAYNALKAALLTYAKQLSQVLFRRGIRVNAVSPGPTEFPGSAWEMVRVATPKLYANTVRQQPLRRMASADEIARAVVFLASPAASWVCGTNLLVDGGFSRRIPF